MILENGFMKNKNKNFIFVQARYNSTRLKGKVLSKIKNKTILEIILKRIAKSKLHHKVVVLCSENYLDKAIIKLCTKLGCEYFIGSEFNVLERYYFAAKKYGAKNIVRITGDCPLIDFKLLDQVISKFNEGTFDYVSNICPATFPDGLDIEMFNFKSLKKTYQLSTLKIDKEHVTQYMVRKNFFKKYNLTSKKNYSHLRLTLDTKDDLYVLKKIFNHFKNIYFTYQDIINLYKNNKNFFKKNLHIKRNQGMKLNEGQKMWQRANNIIPGGTMLFSKNPDLFLPGSWPAYYHKSKGSYIWDLEKKKYLDMSFMGVGTNILGYANPKVDDEVKKVIKNGNMTTLNSTEEVLLGEKLIEMHPWSKKVRFTRTGGEAATVAIRAARAATKKDKIAICGYHGWHDWYLSSNLNNTKSLDNHLMKNLKISGVPKNMKNLTYSFEQNNFKQLSDILKKHDLAAVVMEVARNNKVSYNFLEKVRNITKKNNTLLIFDECTSGFRETFGGIHLNYKTKPDMCILGKALGNGYAINAVLGNEYSMHNFNNTFISSTFWTERIGSVAALATLKEMERIKSWEIISDLGKKIKKTWLRIAKRNKIDISIYGVDALPRFDFNNIKKNYLKTFLTQEFLKKKILASNVIYLCVNHDNAKILDDYFNILDEIFYKISKRNEDIEGMLEGPVCLTGLRDRENYDK